MDGVDVLVRVCRGGVVELALVIDESSRCRRERLDAFGNRAGHIGSVAVGTATLNGSEHSGCCGQRDVQHLVGSDDVWQARESSKLRDQRSALCDQFVTAPNFNSTANWNSVDDSAPCVGAVGQGRFCE